MKDRFVEQLRNYIVISEINGISDIVTLRKKASHISDDVRYILDRGALLFKVFWRKGIPYNDICTLYINYVIKHYGGGTIVVFDGYGNGPSTKDITHIRRCEGEVGIVRDAYLEDEFQQFVCNTVIRRCRCTYRELSH